jgi:hypothetical protein
LVGLLDNHVDPVDASDLVHFFYQANAEVWHRLPGAPLRFRLRFVATLRLRLGTGSGSSASS